MTAYGNIDAGVAGLQQGFDNVVVSKTAAETIKFGAPAMQYKGDDKVYNYRLDTAKVVFNADFVTSNSIAFSVNGVAITPVVFATSTAATAALLVNAIKALAVGGANPQGVEAVIDTTDATNRTILVRSRGAAITTLSTVTLGASQATATYTYSCGAILRGLAMFDQKEYSGAGQYNQYEQVNVVERGAISVLTNAAVNAGMPVYLNSSGVWDVSGQAVSSAFYDQTLAAAGVVVVRAQLASTFSYVANAF